MARNFSIIPLSIWTMLVILVALGLAACGAQPVSNVTPATTAAASLPTSAAPTKSAAPTVGAAPTRSAATSGTAPTPAQKLNLNTATAADFLKVPNVGNNMVREFMEYRPYTSILQFRREIGKYVSAQQVAEYEQYVFVPVNVNSADADTLQQIPGVDKTIAAQLIAARPYASNDVFLQALARFVSAENVTAAKAYLVVA